MFEIQNTEVHGLDRSMKDKGFPVRAGVPLITPPHDKDILLARKLGKVRPGTGHDCYLKGIIVQFHLKAPGYFWPQIQRYSWIDFVSSQSKMYSLQKMENEYSFGAEVDPRILAAFDEHRARFVADPSPENRVAMLANCPMGHSMWAALTSNYMQIKTIVLQRKGHALPEWAAFRKWALHLPMFQELTGITA